MSVLKRNFSYNIAGQVLVLFLSFFAVKYIHADLGADILGLIFFSSIVNLILVDVLQVGFSTTTIREVASNIEKDQIYLSDYLRTSTTLYWAAYLIILPIALVLGEWLVENWIALDSLDNESATHFVQVLLVATLSTLPRFLYVSILRGIEKMGATNLIDVTSTAVQHLGTVLLILNEYSYYSILYWFCACFFFRLIAFVGACLWYVGYSFLLPGFRFYVIRRNAKFAGSLIVTALIRTVVLQFDKLTISKFLPVAAVGYYGFLSTGISKARIFTGALIHAGFPPVSRLFEEGRLVEMRVLYQKLLDFISFATIPLFAFVIYLSEAGLTFIFDKETAELLFYPTVLLCFGMYLNTVTMLPNIFALAAGNSEIGLRQNILDLVIFPPLCVYLIWEYGILGASASSIYLSLAGLLYSARRAYLDCVGLPYVSFILKQTKLILLSLLIFGPMFYLIPPIEGIGSLALTIMAFGFSAACFWIFAYFISEDATRRTIENFGVEILTKLRHARTHS